MWDDKVKALISELFAEMNEDVDEIIQNAPTTEAATAEVMHYVSSTLTAAAESYLVDLYSALSKQTLKEDLFKDPANANRFYELNLRQQISESYQLDIQGLEAYRKGVDFTAIKDGYTTAAAAAGSAAVGGILLKMLSGIIHVPLVVVIAGALLCGVVGGGIAHCKVVPEKNKEEFSRAVHAFMRDLEQDMLRWVDAIGTFYNEKVEALKKTL